MHDEFNDTLDDIWTKELADLDELLIPNYFGPMRRGGILFVGMNPSFNEKTVKSFFSGKMALDISGRSAFAWSASPRINRASSIAYSEWSQRNYHTFFRFHDVIAKHCERDWNHLDLFNFRSTSQKSFEKLLAQRPHYVAKQMDLFSRVVSSIEPEVILIANANGARRARDFLGLKFDEIVGHYPYKIGDAFVPIFLSGMLTNGVLDTFSRERLIWQISQSIRR
ncbi:hypothetical protein [Hyphomonas oceanitis]|uniref:hypothetical protein n=1 Tax=Hyphomonas oceanitis TaxID=81033 RepID=UPI0030038EE1